MIQTPGMTITKNITLSPDVYLIPEGIKIIGNGITLDGNGSCIIGEDFSGVGISICDAESVSIKNISIQNFYCGIRAESCKNLSINDCTINQTHELPANSLFLDIWKDADNTYGSGILLLYVDHAIITRNNLSHQMNGLLTYNCINLLITNNQANYCSGWGFHLNKTSNSIFEHNSADFCCRFQPREQRKGHMGADSAGYLLVNNSCGNKFIKNNARMGGDGFFLAGMTPEYEVVGCNNNYFEENDGSYSPNNAFEATFCQGNIFISNIASHSNYGFWLGFSSDGLVENNEIIGNYQAGLAVENGINFFVRGNNFTANQHGVLLWSKYIEHVDINLPANITSFNWHIERNKFLHNQKAIRIAANQDHGIKNISHNYINFILAPKPRDTFIKGNIFTGNSINIEEIDSENTLIGINEMD